MIGSAAALLMLALGRIAGTTGVAIVGAVPRGLPPLSSKIFLSQFQAATTSDPVLLNQSSAKEVKAD